MKAFPMLGEISPINCIRTTANIRFAVKDSRVEVPGCREVVLDQDTDGSWLVMVRDASDTDWLDEDDRAEKATSIKVEDSTTNAFLNALVAMLADPAGTESTKFRSEPIESPQAAD